MATAQEITVSSSDLIEIIHAKMKAPDKRNVVYIHADQGTGKTETVQTAARLMIWEDGKPADFYAFAPQVSDPADLTGHAVAHPDESGKWVAEHLPYGFLQRLLHADRPFLVLIDEIGHAGNLMQAGIWQLSRNREINGVRISDHVTFVFCGNRAQNRGAGARNPLSPLVGRTRQYILQPSVPDWAHWARTEGGVDDSIITYAEFHPETITGSDENDYKAGEQRPTPRTMADLGIDIKAGCVPKSTLAASCVGSIGAKHGMALYGFLQIYNDLPDVPAICRGDAVPIPTKPEVSYAMTSRLAIAAKESNLGNILKWVLSMPNAFAPVFDRAFKDLKPNLLETEGYVAFVDALAKRRRHDI